MQKVGEGQKFWCAVYTKPQKEEYADLNLRRRGIDTFYPKLFLPRSAKRNQQVVPLFPSYIFVRFEIFSQAYSSITWCPGVKRIVSFNGTPAVVEESIIAFMMGQGGPDGVIVARSDLKVGVEARIDGGPFDGLVGIVQEPPNAKGRVKVLLNILNRQTKVEVPVEFINARWVAARPRVDA